MGWRSTKLRDFGDGTSRFLASLWRPPVVPADASRMLLDMPELAEVDFFRRQWDPGLGAIVESVSLHPDKRVFRETPVTSLRRRLRGQRLESSQTHGKQMAFCFSGGSWLGIHLGMTGALRVESSHWKPEAHDHLVLRQGERALVYRDPRLFGRVRFHHDEQGEPPLWWRDLPPSILSRQFSAPYLIGKLRQRRRAVIKAVLLDQSLFPGVGNWMADEVLWRSSVHPSERVGDLTEEDLRTIWRQTRFVARGAMRVIAPSWGELPTGWLFHERWEDGGRCPRTGVPLVRETIGGRTTCWSPALQAVPKTGERRKRR